MEVKRRTDYAIRMMVRLAMQDEGPMSVTKLAEADDVPYQFARAIQRDLSEAGLIKMKRGVHGGAVLSRPANEISFYDIFLATQGEPHSALCARDTSWCHRQPNCGVHPTWIEFEEITKEFLKSKKLSDFIS